MFNDGTRHLPADSSRLCHWLDFAENRECAIQAEQSSRGMPKIEMNQKGLALSSGVRSLPILVLVMRGLRMPGACGRRETEGAEETKSTKRVSRNRECE